MNRRFLVSLSLLVACGISAEARSSAAAPSDGDESLAVHPDASPSFSASTNTVPIAPGALGDVTIKWDNCTDGNITVSADGAAPTLFASGNSGSQLASWIQIDHSYLFNLFCGGNQHGSTWVLGITQGGGGIAAAPQVVSLPNGGLGLTTIYWGLDHIKEGDIWVSVDGAPTTLFASGASGAQQANWIQAGHSYDFRLLADGAVVASTVVRGVP